MNLLAFMQLFAEFKAASWSGWRAVLARITPGTREFWGIVGRGAGKSRIVALLACAFAVREYQLAPGENVFVGVFGPDRKHATITFRYIVGLLRSVPSLAALIVNETRQSVELSNGVIVEVLTASTAAPRGRSYALAIVEEAALLPTDESANPDLELLRAIRPALARVPGSLLCVVGSPFARRGITFDAAKRYRDKSDTPGVVYVQAPTLALNPTFNAAAVAQAFEEDPISAAAEYGGEFRSDSESFAQREVIEAAVRNGPLELPRLPGVAYMAFIDPAGGGGVNADSFTAAVAHREKDGRFVVDAVFEKRPPFSPEAAVRECADFLKRYGVSNAQADRYAGQFPTEHFAKARVVIRAAEKPKSDLYSELLPLLNSGKVEIPNHPRLLAQLLNLERRTARGGRDSIDHPRGLKDDLANVVAGVAVLLAGKTTQRVQTFDFFTGRILSGPGAGELLDGCAEEMRCDPMWQMFAREHGREAALARWREFREGKQTEDTSRGRFCLSLEEQNNGH